MKKSTPDIPQPEEAKPEMTREEKEEIAVRLGARALANQMGREPTHGDYEVARAQLKLEEEHNPHCYERLLDSSVALDKIHQAIGEENAQTLVIAIGAATNKYGSEFKKSDLEGFTERVIEGAGDWEAAKEIIDAHPEIQNALKEYVLNRLRYDTEMMVAITFSSSEGPSS